MERSFTVSSGPGFHEALVLAPKFLEPVASPNVAFGTKMKFVGKYELLDQVSSGTVEAFTARDSVSGELGVVYLFPASDRPDNLSGIQWALQCFLGLAPLPAAAVVDGGQELGRGYLVSKFDETALQRWASAYKLRSVAAQPADTVLPELEVVESSAASPAGDTQDVPVAGGRRPGEFTQEFLRSAYPQDNESNNCSSNTGWKPSPPEAVSHVAPAPSSFTSEFASPRESSPTAEKKALRPEVHLRSTGERTNPERPAAKAGTGEFTKFFRGPFGVNTSASPGRVEPPETPDCYGNSKGEFTSVFGSASESASAARVEPAVPFPGPTQPPLGEFTRMFGSQESEALARDPVSEPNWLAGTNAEPVPAPGSRVDPPDGVASSTPEKPAPVVRVTSFGGGQADSAKQGATRLFKSEQSRLTGNPLNPLPLPSGPSEYTRVIQAPKPGDPFAVPAPSMAAGAVSPPAAAAPSPPPAIAVGGWPPVPVPAAPVPVPVPVTPPASPVQFQPPVIYPAQPPAQVIPMPGPPAMALPQAATPPQPSGAPGPPRFSYWPLIIGLNVLFIIAVLLVLYFALKH